MTNPSRVRACALRDEHRKRNAHDRLPVVQKLEEDRTRSCEAASANRAAGSRGSRQGLSIVSRGHRATSP